MRNLALRWSGFVSLAWACASIGCGGEKTYPVEGKVKFKDGTPLSGGLVTFELIGDGPAKVCARGDIQPDGTFRLRTFGKDDGALPGRHRVCVAAPLPRGSEGRLGKPDIDERFNRFETSGLEYTVERRKNSIEIEVDRPN